MHINKGDLQLMPLLPSGQTNSQDRTEARKQNLLRAAARVFARKGFQDGTIPEIARESGISEASIYDYYSTKEGLLFAIPIEAIKQLEETMTFHLKLIAGTANRLRAMLYLQLLFYRDNPEFAAVIMLILKHNRRFLDTEGHKAIRRYVKILDRVIQEGIDSGDLRSDIDPYLLRSVSLGAMEHVVVNWLMVGFPKDDDLLKTVDPLIALFRYGAAAPQKEPKGCPLSVFFTEETSQSGKTRIKGKKKTPPP